MKIVRWVQSYHSVGWPIPVIVDSELHHSPCLWRWRQPQACEQCPQWFCPPGSSPCQLCQGTYLKVIMYLSCQYILILPAIITIVQARGTSMPWDSGTSFRPFPVTMNSPDIPLDIQLLIHTLCMWRQAAQAGARIVHPTSYLEPVQRAGGRGSWLQSPNSTHSAFECQTLNNSQQRRHKGLSTFRKSEKVINFSFRERKSTCYVQH